MQERHKEVSNIRGTPAVGQITEITGSRATLILYEAYAPFCPPIGSIMTVETRHAIVLGLTTAMRTPQAPDDENALKGGSIEVELIGELPRNAHGELETFRRGVSTYPKLGDEVQPASHKVLRKAYQFDSETTVDIGTIQQDASIPAALKVDELLGKHFAIVGSTGTGKSCTTALILRQVLGKHPNAHIVMLDPHNEYAGCFGDAAQVSKLSTLTIPYWLLTFEEVIEVLVGGFQDNSAEIEILRELIPVAKYRFGSPNRSGGAGRQRLNGASARFSVDAPVPYRMSDLVALIDTEMGKLEKKNDLGPYKRLKARIETLCLDSRYAFMFGSLTVEDSLKDILKQVFRIPVAGKPISIIQLTGAPSEIVNVAVSVLSRLAFDLALWGEGKVPITFVCEEAHRYVPSNLCAGFEPTKRALSRIAKEGRKYGISLCIVSQRPGDLDPTILSQCSTLITMRLSSASDQRIVASALSDTASSLLQSLPALGNREAIIFGEGVALPSRVRLAELPPDAQPAGSGNLFTRGWSEDVPDDSFLDLVIDRWRAVEQPQFTAAASPAAQGPPMPAAEQPQSQRCSDKVSGLWFADPEGVRQEPAVLQRRPQPQSAAADPTMASSPALHRLAERVRKQTG